MLAWRKILSDVDDTVTCSGGSWPAGVDSSFPKKALYPGVLAFYRELDLGSAGSDDWDSTSRVGNLVFLSARPHVYKSVSESVTYSKFRYLQQERGLYTSPTLLAGMFVSKILVLIYYCDSNHVPELFEILLLMIMRILSIYNWFSFCLHRFSGYGG